MGVAMTASVATAESAASAAAPRPTAHTIFVSLSKGQKKIKNWAATNS
jgi:hypothetical protein